MLDMLEHFRVLAQVFFSFSFVKSLSHCILYLHWESCKITVKCRLGLYEQEVL